MITQSIQIIVNDSKLLMYHNNPYGTIKPELNKDSMLCRLGGSSSDLALEYFSEVKKEDVEKLYQLYKIDFQLFGYSPHLYVK